MSFPKASNQRYTTSRQLIAGLDMNNLTDSTNSYQKITATGATQATAAKADAANIEIASGSAANAGIVLPVSYPGAEIVVLNNSLNTSDIYPNGTDQIQNGGTGYAAASAAVAIATLVSWKLRCVKQGFWQRWITS